MYARRAAKCDIHHAYRYKRGSNVCVWRTKCCRIPCHYSPHTPKDLACDYCFFVFNSWKCAIGFVKERRRGTYDTFLQFHELQYKASIALLHQADKNVCRPSIFRGRVSGPPVIVVRCKIRNPATSASTCVPGDA